MNPVALSLDLILAALLLLALVMGARLNSRLKALRQSHASFARSVAELDQAAGRAEAGLQALRVASEETHDSLLARIDTARTLITRLERTTAQLERAEADRVRAASSQEVEDAGRPSLAALAALMRPIAEAPRDHAAPARSPSPILADRHPAPPKPPPPRRARASLDEDLFESRAVEPPLDLGSSLRRKGDPR